MLQGPQIRHRRIVQSGEGDVQILICIRPCGWLVTWTECPLRVRGRLRHPTVTASVT